MNTRNRIHTGIAFVCGVLIASAGLGFGNGRSESNLPLPERVEKTFKAKFPQAEVTKLDVEKENGVTVYDFEFRDSASEKETDIAADGTMLEITLVIDATAVPPAAMNTIRSASKGAQVKRIEQIEVRYRTHDGKLTKLPKPITQYAVEMMRGDRKAEIVVAPDGSLLEPANWHVEKTTE